MTAPFDLLILGSGSTAFAAAIKANELGARVAMVERRTLGGTCANHGCLPSKNLIEAARIVWEAGHPRYPGHDRGRFSRAGEPEGRRRPRLPGQLFRRPSGGSTVWSSRASSSPIPRSGSWG